MLTVLLGAIGYLGFHKWFKMLRKENESSRDGPDLSVLHNPATRTTTTQVHILETIPEVASTSNNDMSAAVAMEEEEESRDAEAELVPEAAVEGAAGGMNFKALDVNDKVVYALFPTVSPSKSKSNLTKK